MDFQFLPHQSQRNGFAAFKGDARTIGRLEARVTGWVKVDPILSVLVGILILPRTWLVLRESVDILMEATPRGISIDEIGARCARPAAAPTCTTCTSEPSARAAWP